jgi:hypothetical protein
MPSPRPSGLGVWKILLFPQCLHDNVFSFIVFVGYIFKPIICSLLWGSVVCHNTCDLLIFVGLHLSSLTRTLAWLPLPLLWSLSAVSDHMSWFLTTITDDFSFVSQLFPSLPFVILWARSPLFFSTCEPGPCLSWVL